MVVDIVSNQSEKEELYRGIWALANDMRGSVDGWDFKSYVLGTMFYRYISEEIREYANSNENHGRTDGFDYATLSDEAAERGKASIVQEKGFFILPSELFCNVVKRAKSDPNLNETLERVFNHIEDSAKGGESENDFAGLFYDYDVNSNKLGSTVAKRNESLARILEGIANINLGSIKQHHNDTFGDAYEYLMAMYASSAGKSGGEFFTPAEVSELLTHLATVGKTEVNKVYDPACGSGSLLLKAINVLGLENIHGGLYGQEINIPIYNLCRINMFLHGVSFNNFDIACEDTLTNPQHLDDAPFDLIVSNPPFSTGWDGNSNPVLADDPRFAPAGVLAPKTKADLAFIMHSISQLSASGAAAIVCFPGIMYRCGAEQKIRQYLVDSNFVDAIIQLPSNLFYGTSIATCIMVMRKNKPDTSVLFIDASQEFVKATNNNRLAQDNITHIVELYCNRADVTGVAHCASQDEVAAKDYNLSVSGYVETPNTAEAVDITALNAQIADIVAREATLREDIDRIIKSLEQK